MSLPILSTVLIGEGTLLVRCAEHLLEVGHEIRAIVASDSTIQKWAAEHGIRQATLGDADLVDVLSEAPFDYLFSIVNLTVLPATLLALPRHGAINFHDGLLPAYAGLHATSWALINQEQIHGVTWHEMTESVDAGRILKQRSIDIRTGETALSLNARCYEAGAQSFIELILELASGTVAPADPCLERRSYFGKYQRPDAAGLISWERSAEEIAALVAGLTFGPYENPLGLPKIALTDAVIVVTDVAVLTSASGAPAGTVVSVNDDAIHVSTAHGDVALRTLLTIDGQPLPVSDLVRRFGVHAGYRFPMLSQEMSARLTAINARLARHERFWVERLATLTTIELPYANRSASGAGSATPHYDQAPMSIAADLLAALRSSGEAASPADLLVAGLSAYLARLGGTWSFDLGFSDVALQRELAGLEGIFATRVPLRVALDARTPTSESLRAILDELAVVRKRASYVRDTVARFPSLQPLVARGGQPSFAVSLEIGDDLADWAPAPGTELTVRVAADGHAMCWYHDPAVFSAADIAAMQRQFVEFLHGAAAGDTPLAEVSLLSSDERSRMLVEWNATRVSYPEDACIHRLFEAQVDRTPDAVAVAFEDRQITYRELDARANQLARHLQGLGVGPETMVGIFMERSIELIVALYGVHKAGGAYVPLDPTYPADRLSFMVEDSGLAVLLTQRRLLNQLPAHDASVVQVDADWGTIARQGAERPVSLVTSENLAYVIYTSGSTGKPKGVMVKHQNAVNFFVGMDERLNRDPGSVWLAVTSLSFDISVLELFWTLTRGFKVVLQSDGAKPASSPRALRPATDKEIAFSLSYFASDEGEGVADKYQLLMEGAKFADRHGFSAVWTPERHFHAFGGLYPNPSVASAAIAAVTERVQIRAGSVVMPLHSPIRVAEEWSLVDNLSKGRVGISFAAGWQPNDFAIAPERFAARKDVMLRDLATVRKLWRGETVAFPGPTGEDVQVTTLPRPVQAELPVWLTAAGSPETFRIAGEIGAGLLTHLLGQSLEDLTVKLAIYRQAWQAAGHPGTGHATLMLHTFVGDDEETVRETVRGPMKEYLRSSVDLIRKAAWSFPAFAKSLDAGGQTPGEIFDSGVLSDEEMEALLDHAFERYFKSSGLFGTPQSCLEIVDRLKAMDIDEIACLIDFGVPSSVALEHLEQLKTLMDLSRPGADRAADYSIPAQIERHTVTHLQCTPSMAGMLLMDERTRASLRPLKNMMVGGEAFPVPLARQLTDLVAGDVINMYGPTETTIWSSTHAVDEIGSIIPIGRPIANTELYVLDRQFQPVPVGVAGELFIGGDGVVRGYLNRPELTAERFIVDPFSGRPDARLYRTGDLARFRPDGNIELLGRADHQVKIRGYRIELGEIEALLQEHPAVKEAVVVAREDTPGDVRLVGYVVPVRDRTIATAELRDALKSQLPDFMVPAHIVSLDQFPLTPNAKIDRKALPAPDQGAVAAETPFAPPSTDLEATIAGVWQTALNVAQVGMDDSFFDLGGHSLLMVQVQQTLKRTLGQSLAITDLFRFPTIRSLSNHLSRLTDDTVTTQQSVERAGARRDLRESMMRRRQLRQAANR